MRSTIRWPSSPTMSLFFSATSANLHDLIRLYQQAEGTLEQHQHELLSNIHSLAEQMDLAYVLDNVPALMTRSREGLKRIQKIVKDLRDFVRLDDAELKEADLNENVTSPR